MALTHSNVSYCVLAVLLVSRTRRLCGSRRREHDGVARDDLSNRRFRRQRVLLWPTSAWARSPGNGILRRIRVIDIIHVRYCASCLGFTLSPSQALKVLPARVEGVNLRNHAW